MVSSVLHKYTHACMHVHILPISLSLFFFALTPPHPPTPPTHPPPHPPYTYTHTLCICLSLPICHSRTHTHTHTCTHTCMHAHTQTHTHIQTYTQTCMHINVRTNTNTYCRWGHWHWGRDSVGHLPTTADFQSVALLLFVIGGAGIPHLVVLGLAVHSVAGSILLWGHFPVEGIFPLELTWVRGPEYLTW